MLAGACTHAGALLAASPAKIAHLIWTLMPVVSAAMLVAIAEHIYVGCCAPSAIWCWQTCVNILWCVQMPECVQGTAEQLFREALQLQPGHRESATALINVLQTRGDFQGAAELLREQIARQPSDVLWLHLGHMLRCAAELCYSKPPCLCMVGWHDSLRDSLCPNS